MYLFVRYANLHYFSNPNRTLKVTSLLEGKRLRLIYVVCFKASTLEIFLL